MIEHKHAWGESWDIYRNKSVWVVGFKGRRDCCSSLHLHSRMVNHFYVSSGKLVLCNDKESEYESTSLLAILKPGDSYFAPEDYPHRLRFTQDTEGIETYYALPGHEIDPADIVRLSPARAPDAAPA